MKRPPKHNPRADYITHARNRLWGVLYALGRPMKRIITGDSRPSLLLKIITLPFLLPLVWAMMLIHIGIYAVVINLHLTLALVISAVKEPWYYLTKYPPHITFEYKDEMGEKQ